VLHKTGHLKQSVNALGLPRTVAPGDTRGGLRDRGPSAPPPLAFRALVAH